MHSQKNKQTKKKQLILGIKNTAGTLFKNYHLHVPTVLKSGSLNLLEPSGPVQACNGIALTFTRNVIIIINIKDWTL